MRVGIELTALELDRGGTARAIEQLLPLLRVDRRIDLVELAHPGDPPTGGLSRLTRGLARELSYMPRGLRKRAQREELDLLHCPSPLVPGRLDIPMVVTLHDVIGWDHPEWLSRANVAQLRTRLPKALNRGAHVITSSHYSKQRIVDRLEVPEERITVTVLGLDERFSATHAADDDARLQALGLERSYLLTVGTLQPRKNVEASISAFEQLSERFPELDLVVVGARGWRDDELIGRLDRSPVTDRIKVLGRVSDEDLVAVYRGADCFVFPSRYEGFGFPPLEAMACGTPVVSSGATSLAEIVEGVGVVIDPDDTDQIAEEVADVLTSDQKRESMIAKGIEHAASFTWERCAEETVAVYERVGR